jgi:manganese transport protein
VSLTSSRRVMGQYANSRLNAITLYTIATIVTVLNIMLFISVL